MRSVPPPTQRSSLSRLPACCCACLQLNQALTVNSCMQVRPYLMADGGNVELVEIDGLTVYLKLQGACGSCPSSLTTMTMGIKRRLMEKIPVSSRQSKGGPRAPARPAHLSYSHARSLPATGATHPCQCSALAAGAAGQSRNSSTQLSSSGQCGSV